MRTDVPSHCTHRRAAVTLLGEGGKGEERGVGCSYGSITSLPPPISHACATAHTHARALPQAALRRLTARKRRWAAHALAVQIEFASVDQLLHGPLAADPAALDAALREQAQHEVQQGGIGGGSRDSGVYPHLR
jgi:hypothetical protein